MANRDTPIGFYPAKGVGPTHQYLWFPVDSGNSTNMFVGDVLDMDGTAVVPAAADAGVSVVGVCAGLYDTNRISIGHPNSAVSTKYLPSSTAGYALVALALPGHLFIAQAQTGQTPASTSIGATTDHVQGTGDTVTARSRHELNFSDLNTGAQLTIVGLVEEPGNSWAEHALVYVSFNESIWNKVTTGV